MSSHWTTRAACTDVALDVFFPSDGDYEPARAICGRCPVTRQCLKFAQEQHIGFGMFGGLTVDERKRERAAAA